MGLFIDAVLITSGILVGSFTCVIAYNVLHLLLGGAHSWTKRKQRERATQQSIAYYQARKAKLEDQAAHMMASDPRLAELVSEIRSTPYDDGHTKKARSNNYKRAKLQKQLREMVSSKGLRDVFYNA